MEAVKIYKKQKFRPPGYFSLLGLDPTKYLSLNKTTNISWHGCKIIYLLANRLQERKKQLVVIIQWFCNIKAYIICHNRLSHITRIKHLLTKDDEKENNIPLTSILPLNHHFLKVRRVSWSYMIFQFKIQPLHLHTKLNCWTLYNYHYPISFVLTHKQKPLGTKLRQQFEPLPKMWKQGFKLAKQCSYSCVVSIVCAFES